MDPTRRRVAPVTISTVPFITDTHRQDVTMELEFSAEQEMLREMVRGLCASASPLERVRALEDDAVGYSHEFWKQLAELDLIGLMLPTEYGGSGMTALE